MLADVVIDRPWNKKKIQFCVQENDITLDTISFQKKALGENKQSVHWSFFLYKNKVVSG